MEKLENVKIIFYTNYWDGPISGICEYQNKFYRFNVQEMGGHVGPEPLSDDEDRAYIKREWIVREIKLWQLAEELHWHCLFMTNCGQHYGRYGNNDAEFISERFQLPIIVDDKIRLEHGANYYKKAKEERKEIDYSQNAIIGWFSE